jgi:hypothetical protein
MKAAYLLDNEFKEEKFDENQKKAFTKAFESMNKKYIFNQSDEMKVYYMKQWVEYEEDIKKNGYSEKIKNQNLEKLLEFQKNNPEQYKELYEEYIADIGRSLFKKSKKLSQTPLSRGIKDLDNAFNVEGENSFEVTYAFDEVDERHSLVEQEFKKYDADERRSDIKIEKKGVLSYIVAKCADFISFIASKLYGNKVESKTELNLVSDNVPVNANVKSLKLTPEQVAKGMTKDITNLVTLDEQGKSDKKVFPRMGNKSSVKSII